MPETSWPAQGPAGPAGQAFCRTRQRGGPRQVIPVDSETIPWVAQLQLRAGTWCAIA